VLKIEPDLQVTAYQCTCYDNNVLKYILFNNISVSLQMHRNVLYTEHVSNCIATLWQLHRKPQYTLETA